MGCLQLHPVTGYVLGAVSGFPWSPLTRPVSLSGLMHPVPRPRTGWPAFGSADCKNL